MHDVFHVSLLREHQRMPGVRSAERFSTAHREEESREYYVEGLQAERTRNGVREFLVRWKGYPRKEDMTWEPTMNLRHLDLYKRFANGEKLPLY